METRIGKTSGAWPFGRWMAFCGMVMAAATPFHLIAWGEEAPSVPPSWKVLPVPRFADYGADDAMLPIGKTAVVRREGGAYATIRTAEGELAPGSTIIEEELLALLKEKGVEAQAVADTPEAIAPFDTVILLGPPRLNALTADILARLGANPARWVDPDTPDGDLTDWPKLGREGYAIKVGALDGKTVIVLAGNDFDEAAGKDYFVGTYYALQSFRQLIVTEGGPARVKTAEIADKPLVAVRGCYSGFDPSEDLELRSIGQMARIKANQNIWWYGNGIAGYNAESASKFRYPWKPDQLACIARMSKASRERFITMIFCMNPDHYLVDWATAKTFDGSKKDPLHYDLAHPVEPEFRDMWAQLGYDVQNDVDIIAAKYAQIAQVAPGALFQVMNEDDVFGLVHEADIALFNTNTGDATQDAINYGKARAQLLAALHAKIKALCPEYPGIMPICPPNGVCYQLALETNENNCRDFMKSLCGELRALGLDQALPMITTGGNTAAEVLTMKQIEDFAGWTLDAPILICDNNFPYGFHIGAYETDPAGPRFPWQTNADYPSGFRDKNIHKGVWGIHWNGINDQEILGWCQGNYMWNMAANITREELNALAARKSVSAIAYPIVKKYLEEFDNAGCYLPDCQPPTHTLVVSDGIAFRGVENYGWDYDLSYLNSLRIEAQRLRVKLALFKPEVLRLWDNPFERDVTIKILGDRAATFASVYLAYGYLAGWKDATEEAWLIGEPLRRLYLEADDIQERLMAGPATIPGQIYVDDRASYSSALRFMLTGGVFGAAPETPDKAKGYVDIWERGLKGAFYLPLIAVTPGEFADGDARMTGAWQAAQDTASERIRTLAEEGAIMFDPPVEGATLLRMRVGQAAEPAGAPIALTIAANAGAGQATAVQRERWITMPLDKVSLSSLTFKPEGAIRVRSVEVYGAK